MRPIIVCALALFLAAAAPANSPLGAEAATTLARVCMPALAESQDPTPLMRAANYRVELGVLRATKMLADGSAAELTFALVDGKRRCSLEIFFKPEVTHAAAEAAYASVRAEAFAWAESANPPIRNIDNNRVIPRADAMAYPLTRSAWAMPVEGGQLTTVLLETGEIDRDDLFTPPLRLVMILDVPGPQAPFPGAPTTEPPLIPPR